MIQPSRTQWPMHILSSLGSNTHTYTGVLKGGITLAVLAWEWEVELLSISPFCCKTIPSSSNQACGLIASSNSIPSPSSCKSRDAGSGQLTDIETLRHPLESPDRSCQISQRWACVTSDCVLQRHGKLCWHMCGCLLFLVLLHFFTYYLLTLIQTYMLLFFWNIYGEILSSKKHPKRRNQIWLKNFK